MALNESFLRLFNHDVMFVDTIDSYLEIIWPFSQMAICLVAAL